ncbi:MAG: sodium/glutamate symporter [Pseudomonadales bacterium]
MAATFPGVIAFALLAAVMVAGVVLRAKIIFLQKALVPASLLGGALGFCLVSLDWALGYRAEDFTVFAFHFFTLSFMSLVLTGRDPSDQGKSSTAVGGLWLSLIWVVSLALQALVGLNIIWAYNQASDASLSEFLGIIVTHGFTQGPGQAIALGDLWSNQFQIEHALDFGLIYASLGFIAAFTVGVPVARWMLSRNLQHDSKLKLDQSFERGLFEQAARPTSGLQITQPANLDSLALHIGLLGCAYLLTDGYLTIMQPLVSDTAFASIFSYNLFFFHGLMVTVMFRRCLDFFSLGHYVDDATQKRITGASVDLMVTASLISINLSLLIEFWQPILLVAAAVTLVTALLCFGAGARIKHLGAERGLTIFGCCCGSTGSGILLLRILDPNLATPVAKELAFFNIAILFLSFHILGIMAPILPSFDLGWIVMVYGATAVIGIVMVTRLGSSLRSEPNQD